MQGNSALGAVAQAVSTHPAESWQNHPAV